MSTMTKTEQAIKAFRKAGGILTMSEAMKLGIHRRQLYALRDSGQLEIICRGLYRLIEMPEPSLPDFIPVAKKISHGVICLISALAFHEITTQIPHFVYIAIPSDAHKPTIPYPPMRYFWYTKKLIKTCNWQEHYFSLIIVFFFIAFSTANHEAYASKAPVAAMQFMPNSRALDALFEATAEATEEAILDSIIANETMVGADDNTAVGLSHQALLALMG